MVLIQHEVHRRISIREDVGNDIEDKVGSKLEPHHISIITQKKYQRKEKGEKNANYFYKRFEYEQSSLE